MLQSSSRRLDGLPPPPQERRVLVGSIAFDRMTAGEAASMVRDGLARGSGGLMVVVGRELQHRGLPPVLQEAAIVLAGSSTAVWASRLAGRSLPQRTRPAALAEELCAAAAADGHKVFVVGGAPGGPGVPTGAQRAAAVLGLRFRGLHIAGTASLPAGDTPTGRAALCADVVDAKADLVLVGADAANQERILTALRPELPGAWVFGSTGMIDALVGGAGAGRLRLALPHRRGRKARSALAHTARLLAHAAASRLRPHS